jgi:TatD DNase family protein
LYIDIHTHHEHGSDHDTIRLVNYIQNDAKPYNVTAKHYSVGLHPWYLENFTEEAFQQPEILTQFSQATAVGECGLDWICQTPKATQIKAFQAQITLASKLQKPLIIHCVKAFNELVSTIKNANFGQAVLIHGFNNNQEILKQYQSQDYYISVGDKILIENTNAQKALQHIPLNRLFLETDNSLTSIQTIYQKASVLLDIPIDQLQTQLLENFKAFTQKK